MELFLGMLAVLAPCWLVVGLIKPSWALRWGKKKTRLRVFGWFALSVFVIGGAIGVFVPTPPQPQVAQEATDAVKQATAEAEEGRRQAEANREKLNRETEASLAALAVRTEEAKPVDAPGNQRTEQTKASVRRVMTELVAMDEPGSDAAGFARSMAQASGRSVGLGDVYGAFKAAKLAADDSFSRLMQYRLPKDLPETVRGKLDETHVAFRRAAMLRSDIAEIFMEWLDTRKPSLENAMQEKSGQVTLAMTKAIVSLTEAMTAAGFSDDEVKAQLVAMSGKEHAGPTQADAGKPGKKKKGQ